MIYIINREGTTIGAISNPIYEGSAGVNTITLFAPYPANTQILVTAILPNGVPLRNLYPMSAIIPPTSLKDVNGNGYCVFQCTIDENITALTGTVQLFFTVLSGVGKKLNTYTTGFAVSGGNIRVEEIEIPSDSDYIEAVLQYLAELNSDPVQSVVYKAENALISPYAVSAYPTGYNGYISSGFTAEGTTEFIGVEGDFFYLVTSLNGNPRVGFTIDLETVREVKLLQLFMNSATVDINITVEYGATLDSLQTITEKINATSYAVNITPRILLNADARYIRVSFDQNVVVQGIQIFEPSNTAEYVITQKSGAQSVIELSVASIAVDTALSLTSQNPVENRVIAQALQGKQNALTFDNEPTYGSQNPVTSNGIWRMNENTREEIRQAIENIAIPNIYYESNFSLALGTVLTTPSIKANDIIIITATGTPDLVVFNANGQAGSGATVITEEQIYNGNVPTPQAGDRFIVANTGLGVICLESGIVEPNIVIDNALSPTSENPVQNKVITAALNGKQDTLTFDTVPMQGSQNPVTSGGVYAELDKFSKAYDLVLAYTVEMGEDSVPSNVIDIQLDKPYKEAYVVCELVFDKKVDNAPLTSRTTDTYLNYWFYSPVPTPLDSMRYFYFYIKEIAEREWLTIYPSTLMSNNYGEAEANRQCKISRAQRKEQAERYPSTLRISLATASEVNFIAGTKIKVYVREGVNA